MRIPKTSEGGHRRRTRIVVAALVVFGSLVSASPAWAHGDGETKEGSLLVQQAIGYLVNVPGKDGAMQAMEKIDDALATTDQEGVNVADVKAAQTALDADQSVQARTLLQQSITDAVKAMMPATGEETGTGVVTDALPGRGGVTTAGWALFAGSLLILLLGVALARWYRPIDTVRDLRYRLSPTAPRPDTPPAPRTEDAS